MLCEDSSGELPIAFSRSNVYGEKGISCDGTGACPMVFSVVPEVLCFRAVLIIIKEAALAVSFHPAVAVAPYAHIRRGLPVLGNADWLYQTFYFHPDSFYDWSRVFAFHHLLLFD